MKKIYLVILVILIGNVAYTQTNADFEDGNLIMPVPGTITVMSPNGVNGWTVRSGVNSGGNPSCSLSGSYVSPPSACRVIAPGGLGLTDNIIGSGYKVWSVYGATNTTYFNATTPNGFQCYGDWFIKLNNQSGGGDVQKLSKQIVVTPTNCLFQFAYISVVQGSHCCCDNGGFAIKLKINSGCTSAGSYTACPQYSLAPAAGTGCSPTGSCTSPGNSNTYYPASVSGWQYTKWKKGVIDLSSFIGTCVTVEVYAMDCPYGTHAGYTYFDAQCDPMQVIVNGNVFPAATPYVTVSNCGAGSTATITAPSVTGGYTWTCPGPYTIASGSGGQTIYTSISGTHTVSMNPPGSCSPIVKVLNLLTSLSPNMAITTSTMYSCSNPFFNGLSIQMSSGTPDPSINPNYNVSFSPSQPTNTIGVAANSGTYTGLVFGTNIITITDSVGCTATQTINVTCPPTVPSFSIDAPNGTVAGCAPPTLSLNCINTNTNIPSGNMSYTWTSATQPSSVTSSYNAYGNTTYTISGSAPGTCITTITFAVTQSTLVPNISVSPISRTITCNGGCKTFTASTTSGTANIVGTWYDPAGNPGPPSGTPLLICANSPGTYTAQFCSTINGCCSSQTVAVFSNTAIPTISVTSVLGGYVINCTKPCLPFNINSSGTLAVTGYTWTNLSTSVSVSPASGGFTVCQTGANVPGSYEAAFIDGNNCKVTTTINVTIDTLRPSPLSTTNLSFNSYTLNCYTPTLVATAITNPLYSPSSYSWTQPGPLTVSSNTTLISFGSITSGNQVTYTVAAMAPNGCIGKAKVNFYKNTYVPPYGAAFTPSVITCSNPCVAMTATTTSTVSVTYTFTSPPPTQTATTSGALMCVPGTYTMSYQNLNNGCIGTANTTVPLNVTPPATVALSPVYVPCGGTSTIISAGTVTASTTYSYTWEGPPGSAMSCPGGTACSTSSINMPGQYDVVILNTSNGCSSANSVLVIAGSVPVTVSGNNTICIGETATLTASGATTYSWSTGANTSTVAISPTTNTTYTINGSTTSGTTTCVGQSTISVIVNACIGIREYESNLDIVVAPNPNSGKFSVTINLKNDAELLIFNSIGQEVYKQTIKNGKNEINTGTLAKGIYHYNINRDKQPLSRGKILIE